jgi:hypothetical protein
MLFFRKTDVICCIYNVNGAEEIIKFKVVLWLAHRVNNAAIVYVNFRYFRPAFLFNPLLCVTPNASYPNPFMRRFSVFERFYNEIL